MHPRVLQAALPPGRGGRDCRRRLWRRVRDAPPRELEILRRAARVAVCRGGGRAVPEIIFGVLSPTWRLDPKAVAALAPIWQAVRALCC